MNNASHNANQIESTSQKPLFPYIIQKLHQNESNELSITTLDPSFFLTSSFSNAAGSTKSVILQFWEYAHSLSCLRHSSFTSSAECTYIDTFSSLLDGNGESISTSNATRVSHIDTIANVIRGAHVCALLDCNGAIINANENINGNYFRTVSFLGESKVWTSSGTQSLMNNEQIKTVAYLSSLLLTHPTQQQQHTLPTPHHGSNRSIDQQNSPSWFHFMTSRAHNISTGVIRVVNSIFNMYDEVELSERLRSNPKYHYQSEEEIDDRFSLVQNIMLEENQDDAILVARGSADRIIRDQPLASNYSILSIPVVVHACRFLLEFSSKRSINHDSGDFFILRDVHGDIEKVILQKSGRSKGSFGGFLHSAGEYFSAEKESELDMRNDKVIVLCVGKLLSNMSDDGVELLAQTLIESKFAIIEESTITIFPKGVPSNFKPSQADYALFQIHQTKASIHSRIIHIEEIVENSKRSALKAHKNGMTQLSKIHMKRRKAALEELDRCALLLLNLDTSELHLQRAKDDIQIVKSYSLIKSALQDIRRNTDLGDTLEDLMVGIQEEIAATNLDALVENDINPFSIVDDDELNEEFQQLQLTCDLDIKARGNDAKITQFVHSGADANGIVFLTKQGEISPDSNKRMAVPLLINE